MFFFINLFLTSFSPQFRFFIFFIGIVAIFLVFLSSFAVWIFVSLQPNCHDALRGTCFVCMMKCPSQSCYLRHCCCDDTTVSLPPVTEDEMEAEEWEGAVKEEDFLGFCDEMRALDWVDVMLSRLAVPIMRDLTVFKISTFCFNST